MTTGTEGRSARRWRWPLVGAALAVALVVAWYLASPWWAMRQLRAAADAGDAAALSERIDFPAVRQSLKDEVKAALARQVAADPGAAKGLERVGAAMALAFVDPLIDGMVTPEAMAKVVRGGTLDGAAPKADAGDGAGTRRADGGADDPDWRITRDGLSRFTVRGADDAAGKGPALLFERDGLGWRMTGVDLPDGALTP